MRGLLGAFLLAPALASALVVPDVEVDEWKGELVLDRAIAHVGVALGSSESRSADDEDSTIQFQLEVTSSDQACGTGNVLIDGQALSQTSSGGSSSGKGSISTQQNTILGSWTFSCIKVNGVPDSQLMKFDINAVDGEDMEDTGFAVLFRQQVGSLKIMNIQTDMTAPDIITANPDPERLEPADNNHSAFGEDIAELEYLWTQLKEIKYLIHEKERSLARHGRHQQAVRLSECDSLKCVVQAVADHARHAAHEVYGKVRGQFDEDDFEDFGKPHHKHPKFPKIPFKGGRNHTHGHHKHGNHTMPPPPWKKPHHPLPICRYPPPPFFHHPPPHHGPPPHGKPPGRPDMHHSPDDRPHHHHGMPPPDFDGPPPRHHWKHPPPPPEDSPDFDGPPPHHGDRPDFDGPDFDEPDFNERPHHREGHGDHESHREGPPGPGRHRDGPPDFHGPPPHHNERPHERPHHDGPPDFEGPPPKPHHGGPPEFDGPPPEHRHGGPPDHEGPPPEFHHGGPPDFDGPHAQNHMDGPPDRGPGPHGGPGGPPFDGPGPHRNGLGKALQIIKFTTIGFLCAFLLVALHRRYCASNRRLDRQGRKEERARRRACRRAAHKHIITRLLARISGNGDDSDGEDYEEKREALLADAEDGMSTTMTEDIREMRTSAEVAGEMVAADAHASSISAQSAEILLQPITIPIEETRPLVIDFGLMDGEGEELPAYEDNDGSEMSSVIADGFNYTPGGMGYTPSHSSSGSVSDILGPDTKS